MNYVLAAPASRLRVFAMASAALRGNPPQAKWIERGAFQKMRAECEATLSAHVDGEPWLRPADEVREVSIELLPRALAVICPSPPRIS